MLIRLLAWLGIHLDDAPVTIVPLAVWHRTLSERDALRVRCASLEAALAAVEQGR